MHARVGYTYACLQMVQEWASMTWYAEWAATATFSRARSCTYARVHVYKHSHTHTGRELDDMIREVDSDSDMAISTNEFMTMMGMAKTGRIGNG